MLTNPPDIPQGDYEAAIALMQEYDCSYEDAQRHLRLMKGGHSSPHEEHLGQGQGREEYDEEQLAPGEGVVSFTPKQLRALASFLNGSPVRLRPPPPSSFCAKTCLKLKALKRKLRCLKLLHPQRLYRALRQRNSSSYNRLASVELNTSSSQHVKRLRETSSGRWREADEDGQWMDGLEEEGQKLQEYLGTHRELLDGVKAVTREGVKVTNPLSMPLPAQIQPLLFVRRDRSQEIAENVKIAAQKTCRIVCLENTDFTKLFPAASGQAIVIAACNLFLEVQVLSQWGSALSMEDVDCIPSKFKQFLIKNRLFQSILDRDLTPHSFVHHHHQITSFPHEEEEDYYQGAQQNQREADTHQSIIREQDMLYQSMLSTYTARQTEKQAADQETLLRQRQKQTLRQSLRDQPSPCPSSTVQLSFRTPSGSILCRRFLLSDTVQYIRGWVWSSEEVEWQETGKFELYHGYPPVLLDCPPSETLGNVFGGEGQVRLIIKET